MTMRDNLEHYLEAFPDFDRLDAPVFKAIYTARFNQWADRMDALEEMRKALSIDNAYGHTLDLLGQGYNVLRPPGMEDGPFRDLIKMELLANRSGGDLETLNTIGRVLYKDEFVAINETWHDEEKEDLAGLQVKLEYNAKSNPRLINRAKPGGVKMFYELTNEANIQVRSRHLNPVFAYPLTNELVTSTRTHTSVYDVGDVSTRERIERSGS